MRELEALQAAIHQASRDTGRFLSSQVRNHARKEGWPRHLANSLHVAYEDGGFAVKTHPSLEKETWEQEYGTQDRPPSAVIRKFSNRTSGAEKYLAARISERTGGLL